MTATWDGNTVPTLTDVSLRCSSGQILAVVGDVGSGKSTLMSTLLGQLEFEVPTRTNLETWGQVIGDSNIPLHCLSQMRIDSVVL